MTSSVPSPVSGISDRLTAATLLYLGAPSLVFLLGWLNPAPGFAAAMLLASALWRTIGHIAEPEMRRTTAAMAYLAALAALWAALGGSGHFVYANIDWASRDSVYADLILGGWPVAYGEHAGAPLVLRTAMGYFLPPAALAKLLGIVWAPMLLYLWTTIGVFLFLALLPLPRYFSPRLILLSLVPVVFSGIDYLGILLTLGHIPLFPLPLEWWGKWTYSSLTAQLFWAPNHALALWLGAALFFRHRRNSRLPALALMLLPLLLLWTPFAPLGLLPWFAWGVWRLHRNGVSWANGTTASQWVAAIALTVLVSALFSAPGVPAAFSGPVLEGGAWDISQNTHLEVALHYVQFVGCEFLLLSLLLTPHVKALRTEWFLATAFLLLVPAVRFGPSNDWVLRGSTPSLVILMIVTLRAVATGFDSAAARRRLLPVLLVLSVGALTPVFEISRALMWRRTAPNYSYSLVQTQHGYLAPNYVGRLEGDARRILFRTPVQVPESQARQALLVAPPRLP